MPKVGMWAERGSPFDRKRGESRRFNVFQMIIDYIFGVADTMQPDEAVSLGDKIRLSPKDLAFLSQLLSNQDRKILIYYDERDGHLVLHCLMPESLFHPPPL